MSSLARQRRKAEARFGRQTGGTVLSHLFEAGTPVAGRPHADIITRAIADFFRRPTGSCFGCGGDWGRAPSAFLVCHAAVKPTSAALAVACKECWGREDYLEVLSDAAETTLRKLVAGHWQTPLEPMRLDSS